MSRVLRFPKWATRSERHTNKPRRGILGPSSYQRRLLCEPLEDRRLLSVLTVTKPTDDGSSGTLRYEISAAVAGDTIQFAPSLSVSTPQTITLTSRLNITALGSTPLSIVGPGFNHLTVSGVMAIDGGVFNVVSGANAAISDLTINGGTASVNGGGIYDAGTLTVNNCVLSANQAAMAPVFISRVKAVAH